MENKELEEKRRLIIKGLEVAYSKLIEFKKIKKSPIIVSKDGEIVELNAENIQSTTIYKWH